MSLDIRSSPDNTLDFSLKLSNKSASLTNAQTSVQTRFKRVGITTVDVPQTGVRFDLHLGYAFIRQDNITVTRGMSLNGYYAGIGFQLPLLASTHLDARFVAGYTWQSVNGSSAQQSVSLEWNELETGFSATARFARFRVTAGYFYSMIDATQTASGSISETLFLKTDLNGKSQLGLGIEIAAGEIIDAHLFNGSARGVEIQFRKLFH